MNEKKNDVADLQSKAFTYLLMQHSQLKRELKCSIEIINTLIEKGQTK